VSVLEASTTTVGQPASAAARDEARAAPLFEAQDIAISFGGIRAVDGVTFSVDEGEIFAIVGPNGAGKSTIFNLISRIYEPTAGRLRFRGEDITRVPPHTIAGRGIARTFQNIELFEHATVLENLLIGRHCRSRPSTLAELLFTPGVRREELRHREAVEEIIDFLDLANYRDQRISGLAYGVRKVVELARALCAEPRLLLLDEPASGLNTEETEEVAYWIEDIKNDLGVTVIMIEHDMSLVSAVSDRVLALNNGRMLALGTPAEVQSNPAVVEAYLGGNGA
jgi:branched-chain amino acid transport system ATP-binding protein